MKLDNIIYDVDSLALAIAEQWNSESTTFKAMYPSDTATALINVFAGYGSMLQYMLLGAIANCYTTTAFSTAGIYQLADTLGNNLHGNISAEVKVTMRKKNFISVQTIIPAKTQFEIRGKKFFNPTAIVIPATSSPVEDIVLIQGEILTTSQTTSGIANEKFYFSNDFKANHNYLHVYVNGEEWDVADSFLEYDKNYVINTSVLNTVVLKTEPDGRACIKVGDNQLGTLPASGSTITIEYVSNEGSNGNIAEIGLPVSLVTPIIETEFGVSGELSLEITTTSTVFGGADTQSIDILRYTSPYVFASGHRAIRRQDYIALLLNQCGYLTANVWGEYEEAQKVGAYDALMMNMVYYTGIKSYQNYPEFVIGQLSDSSTPENPKQVYNGLINSTNGFWGSFALTINNLTNTTAFVTIQDNNARGILFINDNEQDPRDSILPMWAKNSTDKRILESLSKYIPQGIPYNPTGYQTDDELELEYDGVRTGITILVDEIDVNGKPIDYHITSESMVISESVSISEGTHTFTTVYADELQPGSGQGFKINGTVLIKRTSSLVTTNDDTEEEGLVNQNTITCARSDITDSSQFYRSLHEPTLNKPVQIFIDFTEQEGTGIVQDIAITGVKFKGTTYGTFIGAMAMFGTNMENVFIDQRVNIRNSNDWHVVIPRTTLKNPMGNNTNHNWTDWIATNTFTQTTQNGEPYFDTYKYYVIEIYSVDESTNASSNLVAFESMKFLFSDDSSVIFYDDNGRFKLVFPVENSPGPDGTECLSGSTEHTTIGKKLINTSTLPLWAYEAEISGVTAQNDYREGNVLSYVYENAATGEQTKFIVEVVNPTTGVYNTTINGNKVLTGTSYIMTQGTLPLNPVYEETLNGMGYIDEGAGYQINDMLALLTSPDTTTTNYDLKVRVSVVNQTVPTNGELRGVVLSPLDGYDRTYSINSAFIGEFNTEAISGVGSGATIALDSEVCSGITANLVLADGGSGYQLWDKVRVDTAGTTYQGLVCKVSSGGQVLGLRLDIASEFVNMRRDPTGAYTIPLPDTATGLLVTCPTTAGRNGKINITSSNNLSVAAKFTGNRMDTSTVNLFDQPIIKEYNHFTTYLEFQQPAIAQENIIVQVSLVKNTSVASGVILQNVSNALYSLFDLKPDSIGKGLKLSTIYTTVMSIKEVEWCKVVTPVSNVDIGINEFLVPAVIRVINVTEEA